LGGLQLSDVSEIASIGVSQRLIRAHDPEDEKWLFQPGDLLRAKPQRSDAGTQLTAYEKVEHEVSDY
jgi:hypothetical protein